jgi:hypothetical protein
MDPFEAFQKYVAYKNHFTTKNYDIILYNGKTSVSRSSFGKRSDRYFFHKLSRQRDVDGLLISYFVQSPAKKAWIGDILSNQDGYLQWKKRQESITYTFDADLSNLNLALDNQNSLLVESGSHPQALIRYIQGKISIETLIILNDMLDFVPYWNKKITEQVVWPKIRLLCEKYRPFVKYDKKKVKEIYLKHQNP